MNRIEIGQIIYLKPTGNAARKTSEIKKVTVSKIGRKYFQVHEMPRSRFFIETLAIDGGKYISDWQGYLSIKEIEEEKEAYKLHKIIKKELGDYRPRHTLNQLKDMAAVMGITDDQVKEAKEKFVRV